jgi:Cu-Zn family superoxide dismutase
MKSLRGVLITAAAVVTLTAPSSPALAGPDDGVGATGVFGAGARTYDAAKVPPGARISVWATSSGKRKTLVTLQVTGLLPKHRYGSHAHQLPCGPLPADAGGHFQYVVDPVQPSVDPKYANPRNEIWLDLTTDKRGNGRAQATVNWQFAERRAASVVVHERHTATETGQAGTAGGRYGCLTVPF